MLKLQITVIGGAIEEVPEFYKAQAKAELQEDGLDDMSIETLLAGDVPPDLSGELGTVYCANYETVKRNNMVRLTIDLAKGTVKAERAH